MIHTYLYCAGIRQLHAHMVLATTITLYRLKKAPAIANRLKLIWHFHCNTP